MRGETETPPRPKAERERDRPLITSRNDGLDLLRAAAATMVFGTHAWIGYGMHFLGPFAEAGWLGVYIFFPLSGFLLYRPIVDGRIAFRRYVIARAARLLPAYYIAFVGLSLAGLTPANPLPTLALVGGIFDQAGVGASGFGQSWTIGVEVLFYLVLPVLAVLAVRRGWLLWLLAGASYLLFASLSDARDHWLIEQFPALFWSFAAGMLVARYLDRLRPLANLWPIVLMILAWTFVASPGGAIPDRQLVTVCAAWLIGSATILQPSFGWARLPANLSYSVYLWHAGILALVARTGLSGAALLVPVVVLVVSIAYVSFLALERPVLRWTPRLRPDERDRESRAGVAAERPVAA